MEELENRYHNDEKKSVQWKAILSRSKLEDSCLIWKGWFKKNRPERIWLKGHIYSEAFLRY